MEQIKFAETPDEWIKVYEQQLVWEMEQLAKLTQLTAAEDIRQEQEMITFLQNRLEPLYQERGRRIMAEAEPGDIVVFMDGKTRMEGRFIRHGRESEAGILVTPGIDSNNIIGVLYRDIVSRRKEEN